MSLKLKMTLWYTLLIVLVGAVMLAFMLSMSENAAESTAKNTLETVVGRNRQELWFSQGRLWKYDFSDYEKGVYLLVYDADGNLLEGNLPVALPETEFSHDNFGTVETASGAFYYYDAFVIMEGSSVGVFGDASGEMGAASGEMGDASGEMGTASGEMGGASEEIGQNLSGVWLRGVMAVQSGNTVVRLACIAFPLLVALAALGGWLMTKKALTPVGKIAASAREVSGGEDLSRRIDAGPGRDELHELAETINDMLDRLEKSFLAERQFTSDASHELRTPTAVILAECDTAMKTASTPEEFQQSLAVIQRQGQKMSALIGTLLAYTRREQGTERLEWERTDLSALTEAVCGEQSGVSRRNIRLETDIQPEVTATADPGLITSLIQNLVSNAYQYGREDGHIWVSLKQEENSAVLRVRDDGVGIPADKQPLVWNRFYQVDPARSNRNGSLGLGLAMAKQIARLHGGDITLESAEGRGSEFTFTMPLDGGQA